MTMWRATKHFNMHGWNNLRQAHEASYRFSTININIALYVYLRKRDTDDNEDPASVRRSINTDHT